MDGTMTIGGTANDTRKWIETKCILCGCNENTVVKYPQSFSHEDISHETFSARRETEHYHYRFLKCTCGQVFSSPVLPASELAELYRGSKLTYSNEASAIAGTYIRYLREHEQLLAGKRSALEIGCGNGFFLRELLNVGFECVAGVEPSEDAVSKAGDLSKSIFCGFFEDACFAPNSFDLICCFQTLDHVIDPMGVLSKCHSLLRPGGLLYVIVHNEHAPQARLFGEKSPIYDVEHVYLFSTKTLAKVCEGAGLEPVRTFGVCNTYPLDYWLRMSPLPGKAVLRSAARILRIGQLRMTIPAGNIGIISRKPR